MEELESADFDFVQLEQIHRELENELTLKRSQVEQLHAQLDANNMKIFELENALERSETAKKELELSLKLVQKRAHNLEEKNREMSEVLMKYQMKEEMKTCEIETIKQYTQETAMEKMELSRKVEQLEAQKKYSNIFQKELAGKDAKLKAALQEINEAVKKLEQEREAVLNIEQRIQKEDAGNTNGFLSTENKQLKEKNKKLEQELIEITAKYNKLEELLSSGPEIDGNLQNNLIFKTWKADTEMLRQQYEAAEKIISNMNETVRKEKEANYALILQYEAKLKQLEEK